MGRPQGVGEQESRHHADDRGIGAVRARLRRGGGVAGHVAGGHGTAGAIGGCAIGHHEANKKDKKAQEAQQANAASAPNTK